MSLKLIKTGEGEYTFAITRDEARVLDLMMLIVGLLLVFCIVIGLMAKGVL